MAPKNPKDTEQIGRVGEAGLDPLKTPTKQGVSRTEIDTHSFKCVWGPRPTLVIVPV